MISSGFGASRYGEKFKTMLDLLLPGLLLGLGSWEINQELSKSRSVSHRN
jgi:hypothetical protein